MVWSLSDLKNYKFSMNFSFFIQILYFSINRMLVIRRFCDPQNYCNVKMVMSTLVLHMNPRFT